MEVELCRRDRSDDVVAMNEPIGRAAESIVIANPKWIASNPRAAKYIHFRLVNRDFFTCPIESCERKGGSKAMACHKQSFASVSRPPDLAANLRPNSVGGVPKPFVNIGTLVPKAKNR